MDSIRILWDERRGVCFIAIVAVIAILSIVIISFLMQPKSHIIGEATAIQSVEVADAADAALTSAAIDMDRAASYVRDSYMGRVYGVDDAAWADVYSKRVEFGITSTSMDVKDENIAHASVLITHPDTVALTQKVLELQKSVIVEHPADWYVYVGDELLNILGSVDDVSTSEVLTFELKDGQWTPDEVSISTIARYLYGNVM